MFQNALLDRLNVKYPVFLAPLGGGPSTPALAAAVANAGGLAALAAAYLTTDNLESDVRATRNLTSAPLNVNLFAGGYHRTPEPSSQPMLDLLTTFHRQIGLPDPQTPTAPPDPFPQQFERILALKPQVFSFTFGIPAPEVLAQARSAGILTFGTATTVEEAIALEEAGVDAIVAQGAEAGGQRGTFLGTFERGLVPLKELLAGLRDKVKVPLIASGGLMTGADLVWALTAGASAGQFGTALLCPPEAGTAAPYRRALLAAQRDTTVITYAFTGRGARGLENEFMRTMGPHRDAILPFPLQNLLTRDLRKRATEQGNPEFLSLWAGTGVAQIRAVPAGEIVHRIVQEAEEFLTSGGTNATR